MVKMKAMRLVQRTALALAVVGCCIPQCALAATPAPRPVQVIDIQMHEGNVLLGQVVSVDNAPIVNQDVALLSGTKQLAVAKTDPSGYFAFSGLVNGAYQLQTKDGQLACRAWTKQTAPPSAEQGALVVSGGDTVRGQYGMRSLRNTLANPWVIAAIAIPAIAIPVALANIDDDDDEDQPQSPSGS